jgi:transcriptional regulator with XRE-family HTH domain
MNVKRHYNSESLVNFLNDLIKQQKTSSTRLASALDVSHATMSRWLSGVVIPGVKSCKSIADYAGIPVDKVLSMAGYLPEVETVPFAKWPEFREYARRKYPKELDDDLITMIEAIIRKKQQKSHGRHAR